MKELILMIADDLNKGEITTEYAQTILLRLFNVSVTFCDNINCDKGILTDYYGDKSYCQECGSKQNER
jgi:hypothetical protein